MFQAGQKVRLTAGYIGKPFGFVRGESAYGRPANFKAAQGLVRLHAGCEFTVHAGQKRPGLRFDGPTVLVKNDVGTWCIPERLLEVVNDAAV